MVRHVGGFQIVLQVVDGARLQDARVTEPNGIRVGDMGGGVGGRFCLCSVHNLLHRAEDVFTFGSETVTLFVFR